MSVYTRSDEVTYRPFMMAAEMTGVKDNDFYHKGVKRVGSTSNFFANMFVYGGVIFASGVLAYGDPNMKDLFETIITGGGNLIGHDAGQKLSGISSLISGITPHQMFTLSTIAGSVISMKMLKKYCDRPENKIYDEMKYAKNAHLMLDLYHHRNSEAMKEFIDFNADLSIAAKSRMKFKKPTVNFNSLLQFKPHDFILDLVDVIEFKNKLFENVGFTLNGKADDVSFGDPNINLMGSAHNFVKDIRHGTTPFCTEVNELLNRECPALAQEVDTLLEDPWFQSEVLKKSSGIVNSKAFIDMAVSSLAGYEREFFSLPTGDFDVSSYNLEQRLNDFKVEISKSATKKSEANISMRLVSDDIFNAMSVISTLDFTDPDKLAEAKVLSSEIAEALDKFSVRYAKSDILDVEKIKQISNAVKVSMRMAERRGQSPDFSKVFSKFSNDGDVSIGSAKELMENVLLFASKEKSLNYDASSTDFLAEALVDNVEQHLNSLNLDDDKCKEIREAMSKNLTVKLLNEHSSGPDASEKLQRFNQSHESKLNALERKRAEVASSSGFTFN